MVLTPAEKALYNQIHPAKLATDIGATLPAAWLFWYHQLVPALAVAILPAIAASAVVNAYADLEKLKASPLGRYVGKYMTSAMQAVRAAGAVVIFFASWFQVPWLILIGLVVVLLGWFRGILFPAQDG